MNTAMVTPSAGWIAKAPAHNAAHVSALSSVFSFLSVKSPRTIHTQI